MANTSDDKKTKQVKGKTGKVSRRSDSARKEKEFFTIQAKAFLSLINRNYKEGLALAIQAVWLNPWDSESQNTGLHCARLLNDGRVLYDYLAFLWRHSPILSKKNALILGDLLFNNEQYHQAAEVFSAVLSDASTLKGALGRKQIGEVKTQLEFCRRMKSPGPSINPMPPRWSPEELNTPLPEAPAKMAINSGIESTLGRMSGGPSSPQEKQTKVRPEQLTKPADSTKTSARMTRGRAAGIKAPATPVESPSARRKLKAGDDASLPAKAETKKNPRTSRAVSGAALTSGQPSITKKTQTAPDPVIPASAPKPAPAVLLPELKISFESNGRPVLEAIKDLRRSTMTSLALAVQAYQLSFRVSFDQLICLHALRNVQSLWYQEETARKVMKTFRGRAILSDEVGLGKTIEAGLIVKEYILRGLVRSCLILAPSSLVNQWQEEMEEKFGLAFVTSNSPLFRQDPEQFWAEPLVIVSLHLARSKHHWGAVTGRSNDMVIVDEAHHLKNQTTQGWKLVNALQKTFILLLTATPVQNKLEELYNLVTLLRPGHLKTRKAFMEEFVTRGNPTDPRNREKLRRLLQEVMVRNTRSVTQLRLPPRFALTVKVSPSSAEDAFYQGITALAAKYSRLTGSPLPGMTFRKLLEAAGSSHYAAMNMLDNLASQHRNEVGEEARQVFLLGKAIQAGSKTAKVLDLIKSMPERKIVFVNYLATLEHLRGVLKENHIRHTVFHGGLTSAQKQAAIDSFRDECQVLLTTGMGGEGHNLQFCHIMLNYDLPWNPMQIEQRIGRIHRIGQEKEVRIFNFCAAGTIEDRILDILDRKINMFELVVGEVDMILGRLQDEKEFADMVFEMWVRTSGEERDKAFGSLAAQLKKARTAYDRSKELDEKLFREDYEA
ncbi:MAG: DEAD/DEAH box helicase family protein [Deltaproteobacteria bacterium]|nr:DEAD/DEAH box helicase family protein [Deltaproteobacteria bacterium]